MALYLQSVIEGERYLLPTNKVVEIVPYVIPKKIPHAPDYIVGLIDYRGRSLPLIDMCQMMVGIPCRKMLCSRIVIGKYHDHKLGEIMLGWLFEGVTETVRFDDAEFVNSMVHLNDAEYLADVVTDEYGILQRISLEKVLPEDAYHILFDKNDAEA